MKKTDFILNILFEYEKQIFFFPIFHTKHDENEINKHIELLSSSYSLRSSLSALRVKKEPRRLKSRENNQMIARRKKEEEALTHIYKGENA
jgi:hypothetical protein